MNTFPDMPHILRIKDKLWCDPKYGKAAVMVGAGFSTNADKISSDVPDFPLWKPLIDKMLQQLNFKGTCTSSSDALRIANEYEIMFTRLILDEFLLNTIPDQLYQPGELHKILLELPWSDVFTTNYDTLLERTCPYVHTNHYDLVSSIPDIPNKIKPRIIKLHGSFPSTRPFIITEEDYRTYPVKFAPFVNTVQQSIMENIFCLIGFSGDDPNFLHWTGWVRDNLGESTPPIYLCGLLNLSPSKRKLLESRNIVPIDLSPKFPPEKYHDEAIRHKIALKWFLLTLLKGELSDYNQWAIARQKYKRYNLYKDDLIPVIPGPEEKISGPGREYKRSEQKKEPEDFKSLINEWKKIRKEYPNWVIAPLDNRRQLLRNTFPWISSIIKNISLINFPENLYLIYELFWRIYTTLITLADINYDFSPFIEIIKNINPFPGLIDNSDAGINPLVDEYKENQTIKWKRISACWVELVFILIESYRDMQDTDNFKYWSTIITPVLTHNKEWYHHSYYEYCLFYIYTFQFSELFKTLKDWQTTEKYPLWHIRKAALIAEYDNPEKAEKMAESALLNIQHKLSNQQNNRLLLSQEGLIIFLLDILRYVENRFNQNSKQIDVMNVRKGRLVELESYRCNPEFELEKITMWLKQPKPLFSGYEPKYVEKLLPAFSLIKFHEWGGIPFFTSFLSIEAKALGNAATWIYSKAPFKAISVLIRTGYKYNIEKKLHRISFSTIPGDSIDKLFDILYRGFSFCCERIMQTSPPVSFLKKDMSHTQFIMFAKIISLCCYRFTEEQIQQLFEQILYIYKTPVFSKIQGFHSAISLYFKNILNSMSYKAIKKKFLQLLLLPIPGESGYDFAIPEEWPEPFDEIIFLADSKSTDEKEVFDKRIDELINLLSNKTKITRNRAYLRLFRIYSSNGLNEKQQIKFIGALNNKINSETGLPDEDILYLINFIHLPFVDIEVKIKNLRQYLLNKDLNYLVENNGKVFKFTTNTRYINEILYSIEEFYIKKGNKRFIEWQPEDAKIFFNKIKAWWENDKICLENNMENEWRSLELKTEFEFTFRLFVMLIIPKFQDLEESAIGELLDLYNDFLDKGLCVLQLMPSLTIFDAYDIATVTQEIRKSLCSSNREDVSDAVIAIYNWFRYYKISHGMQAPPKNLFDEMINRILLRKQPKLDKLLIITTLLLQFSPELFSDNHLESIYIALEYLFDDTYLIEDMSIDIFEKDDDSSWDIPIKKIPRYRKLSAELAFHLYNYLEKENLKIPEIIEKWKTESKHDKWPDVRRVWEKFFDT